MIKKLRKLSLLSDMCVYGGGGGGGGGGGTSVPAPMNHVYISIYICIIFLLYYL